MSERVDTFKPLASQVLVSYTQIHYINLYLIFLPSSAFLALAVCSSFPGPNVSRALRVAAGLYRPAVAALRGRKLDTG